MDQSAATISECRALYPDIYLRYICDISDIEQKARSRWPQILDTLCKPQYHTLNDE